MMLSPPTCEQFLHRVSEFHFLVHLLKITRIPSPVPTLDVTTLSKSARKNALKVTALYGSKQVALGDFPVLKNECIINQQLIFRLNLSKSDAKSKLYFYIDQAYSSGLTGHMALDLKEFIREGDTEVYLKYPLYANNAGHTQGPILKMTIQNIDKMAFETFDEDNDVIILQRKSVGMLHASRIKSSEVGCVMQAHVSAHSGSSNRYKTQLQHLDETRLLKLEGALSDLDEKIRILTSAYKNIEYFRNNDSEAETRSSVSISLPSSDSHSELCEKLCTDSDDPVDSFSSESEIVMHRPFTSMHSRTLSDIGCLSSNLGSPQMPGHMRNRSTDVSSVSLCSQSTSMGGGENEAGDCPNDCFVCSRNTLHSFEGIHSSLSRNSFVPLSRSLSVLTALPPWHPTSKRKEEVAEAKSRKGPGLLKGLFGAVVFAGVTLLGARNTGVAKRVQPQAGDSSKLGQSSHLDDLTRTPSTRGRTLRNRYSFS